MTCRGWESWLFGANPLCASAYGHYCSGSLLAMQIIRTAISDWLIERMLPFGHGFKAQIEIPSLVELTIILKQGHKQYNHALTSDNISAGPLCRVIFASRFPLSSKFRLVMSRKIYLSIFSLFAATALTLSGCGTSSDAEFVESDAQTTDELAEAEAYEKAMSESAMETQKQR